jgi:hypothetical protein
VDIILQTHDSKCSLELRRIECCEGDYFCTLMVRSGDFSAEHRFDFGGESLARFCTDLATMDEKLIGSARLRHPDEPDELVFEAHGWGSIQVSGHLVGNRLPRQELRFAFVTDQTCLAPLIRDLKGCSERACGAGQNAPSDSRRPRRGPVHPGG